MKNTVTTASPRKALAAAATAASMVTYQAGGMRTAPAVYAPSVN